VRRALLLSMLCLGIALAGCGESEEDKARADVCDARADIEESVNDLQNLTLGTATVDQVKSDLNAISDGLTKMADAQDQLDDTRKKQVQKANETFKSQVSSLVDDLGSSRSLQDAVQRLETGIANLAKSYEQAIAPIDCS
jgi:uncharacterized phage infection (PIP) family protein YhgE